MKRIENITVAICSIGVGIAFMVLMAAVLTQVVGRTLASSPVWTEELTRIAMLFVVAFGAGLSFRSGDLVNVDIVCDALPGNWPRRLRLCSAAVTFILCAILIPPAWKYVSIGKLQTSPALGLRMDYIHLSVWLLLVVLAVFSLLRVVSMIIADDSSVPANRMEQ
ncbi:TRAP transporter small permease [Thalassovita autumnalis]|uniref:TRAP transporter small permease n=1 Tax=Thalassovita autumnalis TaxID=2072972 RepID=UPI00071E38FF|nr:TRAP transporter small permease subunit [Thalassovita autumnalis]